MLSLGGLKNRANSIPKEGVSSKSSRVADRHEAASKLQRIVRIFLAKARVKRLTKETLLRVFDPEFKRYFWYDKLHQTSQWSKPSFLDLYDDDDIRAALTLQRVVRGFNGRQRAKKIANDKYVRYFDVETTRFYWLDKTTQKTTYNASKWLQRQNINMPSEDKLLLQSQLRIKELERKLAEKEMEIKQVRKKRYEELEPEVIKDKVKAARNMQRSKNIDEWTVDDLAAWFTELKMDEYIPYLFANRIDGLLFINLSDEEIRDMGIVNKFHLRKLELIMKSYRIRYQRKKQQQRAAKKKNNGDEEVDEDEEEELLSEYSPSELSAIIAAEEADGHGEEDGDGSEGYSFNSDEEDEERLTEEQRLQMRLDQANIKMNMVMKGDEENYPLVGDIVRVKYKCELPDGKVVMSTKHMLDRPWIEFVLGVNQVIKGFDRALPLMSVGERSKITVTPEYGYGKDGLPPNIPPDSELIFDVTLLGFRPRSTWIKPLIQDVNTDEKPYHKDLKISLELATKSGMPNGILNIFSTSMVLNEDEEVKTVISAVTAAKSFHVQPPASNA